MHLSRLASRALYWGAASAAAAAVLQLTQLAILARVLSPADFGLAAMMGVALGLASAYGDMGLSNAVLTHSPLSRRMLSSLYWIGLLTGALLAAIVALAAPLAAHFFSEPRLTSLVRWSALVFLINPLGLQFQLLFQKDLEFRPLAAIEIPASTLGVLATVLCAWRGLGVLSFVVGSLVGAAAKAAGYFTLGTRRWPLTLECAPSEAKELLGFGAFQVGERTVNFCARNLDKAVIGWLLGASALGFYNTAYQLMQRPLQLIQPLATKLATPLFVHVRSERERLVNAYVLIVELAAMTLFPVFALLVVLAGPVVAVILGPRWLAIAPVLQWLSLLGCFYAVGFPVGSLLIACKRADLSFWLNVWALIPFTAAILIGSRFGLLGIAIALVIAQAVGMFTVGFWLRSKLLAMSPSRYMGALVAPTLITTSAAAIVALWVATTPRLGDWPHLMWGTLLFVAIYAGCFLAFRRPFLRRVAEHFSLPGAGLQAATATQASPDEET
jgi:O-antigen/teichoic acid export membrane protein